MEEKFNSFVSTVFFGVGDHKEFCDGLQSSINQIMPHGIYTGDNLFTFGRNLGFLDDEKFMAAYGKNAETEVEKAILWRYATILWGVRRGLKLEGDFVECACYKGTTVKIMCDTVGFSHYPEKKYYLYDLFEHDASMPHHSMPEHGENLFEKTKSRFLDMGNVIVSKGCVPDILNEVAPEKIAFMHIDMNNARAEIDALEFLFDRMVPGALLILDDYGWIAYREQKIAEDAWLGKRGYQVLELPTGQGLVIK